MVRQEVHVAPVSEEVDRVVLPFLPERGNPPQMHAHRLVLVVPPEFRATAAKIRDRLRSVAVVEEVPLDLGTDRSAEFRTVLEVIARVLAREIEKGHRVHLNLSSGSKMVCVAAGMAAMAHIRPGQGSIYNVRPAGHSVTKEEFEAHGRTKGLLHVDEVEPVPVLLPEALSLRVLGFLREQPRRSAEYRDLIKFLSQIPGSGYQSASVAGKRLVAWNNAVTTRMVRKVLTPLEDEGLVEVKSLGRQKGAQLTSRGMVYAALAAPDAGALRRPLPL
ncbi:MAG: hypothetical protein HYT80_08710 [Euryarchaeota archaeon]|nr:hypothetical protein [Euryarchaeota archaeon]